MRSSWKKARHMSFRARLGTFIALAVGLTVALASLASYFVVRHQLYAQLDSSLKSAFAPGDKIRASLYGNILSRSGNGFLQVIGPDGGVYYNSFWSEIPGAGPLRPTSAQIAIASNPAGAYRLDTETYNGAQYRVITETGDFNGTPAAIQIGRPLGEIDHTLSTVGLILWFVTLGGIGIAVGLGYLIGRETIRPVTRLTEAAEYVAATQDLSSSIEVSSDDELGRLARSFNSMLAALAASRDQQAQLISDAGHELRTPLTSLRTNIEVLMRMPNLPGPERAELYSDVEAQLQELTNLIGDLVDLARQEERQPEPIEVRLDAIVAGAIDRARRRAPNVTFESHLTPGSVRAQPALLERAVLNVLDNAVKWSPPGSTVEVWLQRGSIWTLDVHDHGPGIAPEDLPHVFDRFYRAASARSLPGSGLGLAIVSQVVTNHGGTVSASVPPEGGTVVHIELPIVAEEEAVPPHAGQVPSEGRAGDDRASEGRTG
ncbi:MAG TPA: ATP-binding protein, partial [Acidimicrobiales bacterium]|nr:ATP-binding protein [Acidimicrobiales bacterium]